MATKISKDWFVAYEPIGENPGATQSKNLSGIKVVLTDGDDSIETERVAFLRDNTKFPDLDFKTALEQAHERAQTAAEEVNKLNAEVLKSRAKLVKDAQAAVRLALGRPPSNAKPS